MVGICLDPKGSASPKYEASRKMQYWSGPGECLPSPRASEAPVKTGFNWAPASIRFKLANRSCRLLKTAPLIYS